MTEYTSFDEFIRQLEEVVNTAEENSSAVKKQKKTKASVSLVLKDKSAVNRGNKSASTRGAEVSTDMEKMNSFVSEFLTKAEEFRRNIDPTVFQSPFTMEELNRVNIKRNAPFFPNLLTANGEETGEGDENNSGSERLIFERFGIDSREIDYISAAGEGQEIPGKGKGRSCSS